MSPSLCPSPPPLCLSLSFSLSLPPSLDLSLPSPLSPSVAPQCPQIGHGDERQVRSSPYTAASFARLLSHSLRFLKLDLTHALKVRPSTRQSGSSVANTTALNLFGPMYGDEKILHVPPLHIVCNQVCNQVLVFSSLGMFRLDFFCTMSYISGK